jgi:hypothetical protein
MVAALRLVATLLLLACGALIVSGCGGTGGGGGGGDITLSPSSINYQGAFTSETTWITYVGSGSATVIVGPLEGAGASRFRITSNSCLAEDLDSFDNCSVTIRLLVAGSSTATITVRGAGRAKRITVF